jgi:hypothetical protein
MRRYQTPAPSIEKISIERDQERLGGDDVPTRRIPRSKERPLDPKERRWRRNEGGHPWLSAEVKVDAMGPNSRSFDRKDLSIERSGTVSVATMSPSHTEFPGQRSGCLIRRSGCLIRRSGDGGSGHHGRLVMDSSVFVIEIFLFTRGRGGGASTTISNGDAPAGVLTK